MNKYVKHSLGDLLLQKGAITPDQLEQARKEEKSKHESLFRVLPQMGFITPGAIADIVAEVAEVPRIELGYMQIDPAVLALLPEELVRRRMVVPVIKVANNLTCAMVDIFNVYALDELALKTGMIIEPAVSTEEEINQAINDHYAGKGDLQEAIKTLDENNLGVKDDEEAAAAAALSLKNIGEEHPVVKFVNTMIAKAVSEGASDVHIEPEENSLAIRFRVDGILRQQFMPPKQFRAAIISRIKIMASLDIAEHRRPQDGRIQMEVLNRRVDVRVSFLPTVYGENVVMRLLDTGNILLGLEKIGIKTEVLEKFRDLLRRPNGIILVTGPTGSGKTTTLYSAISTINTPDKSIVTIEDPVEYRLPGVRQTQVDLKVDLTFSKGLRAILRQDPNVIMIGEIRDPETAQIAIQAALTGHLVFATLHTNNAAGAVTRLLDIGIEPFLISSSIIGVMAQRLIRLSCKDCSGKGCSACSMTGFKGRSGIYELLCFDDNIRQLVLKKVSAAEIHRAAVASGMQSLRDCGLEKAAQGLTTNAEIYRVTQEE